MKTPNWLLPALVPLCLFVNPTIAQDELFDLLEDETEQKDEKVYATFKTTRLILGHTIETVKKKSLDFRITHRFGDIAGNDGGKHTLYGFDNVADVRLSFEYGITDDLTVAVGRSKGGNIPELWDGHLKFRALKQRSDFKVPVTITLLGSGVISSAVASANPVSEISFKEFSHRVSYVTQAIIASKLHEYVSIQVVPTWVHRNYVAFGDENDMIALGLGARIKFSKRVAIIVDYYLPFSDYRTNTPAEENRTFYNPLGVGVEIETGGHVSHINFSNSTGVVEQEFIPYTVDNWLDGEFRLGFNISRVFSF